MMYYIQYIITVAGCKVPVYYTEVAVTSGEITG